MTDHSTEIGAERLARRITDYWAERGVRVLCTPVQAGVCEHGAVWGVKSVFVDTDAVKEE